MSVRGRRPIWVAAVAGVAVIIGVAVVAVMPRLSGQTADSGRDHADAASGLAVRTQASAPPRVLADGRAMNDRRRLAEFVARSVMAGQYPSPQPPARRVRPTSRPSQSQPPPSLTSVYLNPLRSVTGLVPERIDMGVDFGGSGPVYAIGNGVITNATADSSGWPGGGWVTYRLTDGPAAGLQVYVAEDVTPAVQVGEAVSSSTVIANMFNGGDGIETGWAQPDGASSESELPEAGGINGAGPFPTKVGVSFDALLQALGVSPGSNSGQAPSGILPPGYLMDWAGVAP
jgi:hypothetical protein